MGHKRIFLTLVLIGLLWGVATALSWAQYPISVQFWSQNSVCDGKPVPVGTMVVAYDPTGVECGTSVFVFPGTFQVLHCNGDQAATPEDEGAEEGDVISFSIDGLPTTAVPIVLNATPVPVTAPITWTGDMVDLWEVKLSACTPAGDLNCNCRVDVADIQYIASQWGLGPGQQGYYPPYDLDDNDIIGVGDLQWLALSWRETCQ